MILKRIRSTRVLYSHGVKGQQAVDILIVGRGAVVFLRVASSVGGLLANGLVRSNLAFKGYARVLFSAWRATLSE